MKKKIFIKFLPLETDDKYSKQEKEIINDFTEKFLVKEFDVEKISYEEFAFTFSDEHEGYKTIMNFVKKSMYDIQILINAETEYEQNDYETAEAYLLFFPEEYDYFDNEKKPEYNSFTIQCTYDKKKNPLPKPCGAREHTDKIFVQYDKKLKKVFHSEYTGATNYAGSQGSIISDGMYSVLRKNGVDEDYFKPVYNKEGERWAYFLEGKKHILPTGTIRCNYKVKPEPCPKCGRMIVRNNEDIKEELYDEFSETIIIGIPNILERWTINSEGIAALKDINLTQDFFGTCQLTIVNKKVFFLLKDRIPELLNRSVPIFRK